MFEFAQKNREEMENMIIKLLEKSIKENKIDKDIKEIVSSLIIFKIGLIIENKMVKLDPKKEIEVFLETLFKFIEIKEIK